MLIKKWFVICCRFQLGSLLFIKFVQVSCTKNIAIDVFNLSERTIQFFQRLPNTISFRMHVEDKGIDIIYFSVKADFFIIKPPTNDLPWNPASGGKRKA